MISFCWIHDIDKYFKTSRIGALRLFRVSARCLEYDVYLSRGKLPPLFIIFWEKKWPLYIPSTHAYESMVYTHAFTRAHTYVHARAGTRTPTHPHAYTYTETGRQSGRVLLFLLWKSCCSLYVYYWSMFMPFLLDTPEIWLTVVTVNLT